MFFKDVVLNAHNNGGRVLVTSNMRYDDIIEKGFSSDLGEKEKYRDRTKQMFKVLELQGDSHRQKKRWYMEK